VTSDRAAGIRSPDGDTHGDLRAEREVVVPLDPGADERGTTVTRKGPSRWDWMSGFATGAAAARWMTCRQMLSDGVW
jgi:hypothetical protein